MKAINSKYVIVKKIKEEKKEGFATVDVTDNFIYKGEIHRVPDQPLYIDNYQLAIGDIVQFTKYSPDTHETDIDGEKMKALKAEDIIFVL